MHKTLITAIVALTFPLLLSANTQTGFYQVQKAWLSVNNCNTAGRPTHYASQFLRVAHIEQENNIEYKVSTCDGEEIDELFCDGYKASTRLNVQSKYGIEGYHFTAKVAEAQDGTPRCDMTALRRRITPGKGGFIRYERTDWGTRVADYSYECTRDTAQLFFEAQSLHCSTHIVIDALHVPEKKL